MLWIHAEDAAYYDNPALVAKELSESHRISMSDAGIKNIQTAFTLSDVKQGLSFPTTTCILSPSLPNDFISETASGMFTLVYLKNRHGVLTTTDKKLGISAEDKLEKKIGMKVHRSTITFNAMAGAEIVKKRVHEALVIKSVGIPLRGVLLVGIFGTGKSFFAKCFAGETGRTLVELNLARLLYTPNPIAAFNQVIDFLVEQNGRYVLWLDEIEKMFRVGGATGGNDMTMHLLNAYLTFQNEIGRTIDLDVIVVATANKIDEIMANNPEVFRAGRFDLRFFLNFPTRETAEKVFNLHIDHINKDLPKRFFVGLKNLLNNELDPTSPFYPYIKPYRRAGEDVELRLRNHYHESTHGQLYENAFVQMCETVIGDAPQEFEERFRVDVDTKLLVNLLNEYRHHGDTDSERVTPNFPYVHAEIENLCQQLFARNAVKPLGKGSDKMAELVNSLAKDNIPLALSSRSAINKMAASRDHFITVE